MCALLQTRHKVRVRSDDLQPEVQVVIGAVKHIGLPRRQSQLQAHWRVVFAGTGDLKVIDPAAINIVNHMELTSGCMPLRLFQFPLGQAE
jgi:hypothetical protein